MLTALFQLPKTGSAGLPFHQDFDITAVISKFSVSLATGRSQSGTTPHLIT